MTNEPRNPVPLSMTTVLLAGVSVAMWATWLGWDQHRDVHPDGSTTGPYEAWQVIGLGLGLLIPVCWAAFRGHGVAAVLGTSGGLALAAAYDWSDDGSGLFVIGVGMVMIGSVAATGLAAVLTSALHKAVAGVGRPSH
ncbi:hypothetical protein GCM10010275_71480 [Streptomyces litmocidini]|uniref:hypothetical protein n=1 Tax=Streptomyces litmocidini TaxID=67318 RepID=UPI00167D8590|nr:hypothetical protein [Streptomyces litmocidini]GGV19456.1 hypothetical protein GCM10010275_71480 [Streptomyces litmocidini]